MEQLIGDCRQMAAHWHMPSGERTSAAPAGLHGITVPPASAHVVAGMVEFGD